MNYIKNDYGNMVIAIGAPASVERIKIERPKLIVSLQTIKNLPDCLRAIRLNGITSVMETGNLLLAAGFENLSEQPCPSI